MGKDVAYTCCFYSGYILFSAETFKLSGLSAAQLRRQPESALQLAPTNLPLQKCKQVIRLERALLYNGQDAKSPYKMNIKRCAIRKINIHMTFWIICLLVSSRLDGQKNCNQKKSFFISSAIISHGRFPTYVLLYPMVDFQHVLLYPSYQLWCKIFFPTRFHL